MPRGSSCLRVASFYVQGLLLGQGGSAGLPSSWPTTASHTLPRPGCPVPPHGCPLCPVLTGLVAALQATPAHERKESRSRDRGGKGGGGLRFTLPPSPKCLSLPGEHQPGSHEAALADFGRSCGFCGSCRRGRRDRRGEHCSVTRGAGGS